VSLQPGSWGSTTARSSAAGETSILKLIEAGTVTGVQTKDITFTATTNPIMIIINGHTIDGTSTLKMGLNGITTANYDWAKVENGTPTSTANATAWEIMDTGQGLKSITMFFRTALHQGNPRLIGHSNEGMASAAIQWGFEYNGAGTSTNISEVNFDASTGKTIEISYVIYELLTA